MVFLALYLESGFGPIPAARDQSALERAPQGAYRR
jgi:hypothetical protein